MIFSETYEVQDCWRYNPLTSNDNLFSCKAYDSSSSSSNCQVNYSNNGLTVNTTGNNLVVYNLNDLPTGDFSIEFEYWGGASDVSNGYKGNFVVKGVQYLCHSTSGQQVRRIDESAQSWVTPVLTNGDIVRFDVIGSTVSIYQNDVLNGSKSIYNNQTGFYTPVQGRTIICKNMKIKPL